MSISIDVLLEKNSTRLGWIYPKGSKMWIDVSTVSEQMVTNVENWLKFLDLI